MDEFNKIRKEFHVRGKSVYKISREYNRSWDTVNKIVSMPEHKVEMRGKRPRRQPIVITPEVEDRIHQFIDFEETNRVPKKQRFTAAVIFKKLTEEGVYKGSSKRMRTVVSRIRTQRKKNKKEVYLNLNFEFGQYLQVDHGPVLVQIDDKKIDGYLFVGSVPGATLRYCQFYPTKSQEAWGHFHERCFSFFGGTFSQVIYDNDSVLKISKSNQETDFSRELQIHYKFTAIYCNKASGWEKGAVESAVGYCRRNFLPGIPQYKSIFKLNDYLENISLENILEGRHYISKRPIVELFDELKNLLKKFNYKGKIWGKWLNLKVDKFQQIKFGNFGYSVPEKYVGNDVKVFVSIWKIDIYDEESLIHSHYRRYTENDDGLEIDHYLDQLKRKPRAVRFAQVVEDKKLPPHIKEIKRRLYELNEEKIAAKQFINILLLKRKSDYDEFDTAIELALTYNAINDKAVTSILKQLQIDQYNDYTIEDYPKIDHHFCLKKYSQLENWS